MNFFHLLSVTGIELETQSTTNPILDKDGNLVPPEEALGNFARLWKEWDLWGKFCQNIPKIILAVIIIVAGFFIARGIAVLTVKAMKRKKIDASVYLFVSNVIKVVIRVIFILLAVSMFYNINSFLAALGAIGLTVGLGLQESVAQLVSGIQILANRPFRSGDYIEVGSVSGSVVEIRFMNTIIRTLDNKTITIPNSHITKNEVINYTAEPQRRVDLVFSISYSDDIAKAKRVIRSVIDGEEKILKEPESTVTVLSHESSSVDLAVRVWCLSADYWDVYFAMQEDIKLAFDANGINIPFNQLDVHIIDNKKPAE